MPKYIVTYKELVIYSCQHSVEANSEDEALDKVKEINRVNLEFYCEESSKITDELVELDKRS